MAEVSAKVVMDLRGRTGCGMHYVNARWLGGMMTNFRTIRKRIDRMEQLKTCLLYTSLYGGRAEHPLWPERRQKRWPRFD